MRAARQVDLKEIGHRGEDHRAQSEPEERAGDAEAGGQQGGSGRGYPDRYYLWRVEDGLLFLFVHGKTPSVCLYLTGGRRKRNSSQASTLRASPNTAQSARGQDQGPKRLSLK
jgi:hypothetical protein